MANEQIPLDDLELSEIDIYKDAMYEGKPFTGTAVDDYKGIHTEWPFVDGNGHGRWFSVYSDGQLQEEIMLDHGEMISERTWNKAGCLIHKADSSPFLEQDFNDEGILIKERTADYLRLFFNDGVKQSVYDYLSSSVIIFAHSEVWIVKGKLKDKYFILARENMDFNDEYWTENYISILKDDYEEFYPFFRTWLKDKKGLQKQIICTLIENTDLRLKYDGMLLAREYGIKSAVPLIEKQVSIKKCPPSTENIGYGRSVGYMAEQVLKDLRHSIGEIICGMTITVTL